MKNSIDLDLLNELIKKCESKMASPFRKNKEPMEGLGKSDEVSEDEPTEMMAEKSEQMPEEEAVDMDALMELYKKIKA